MNVEFVIRTSWDRSPGFSRIRCSRQYATVPAGIPPAEAGTPGHAYPDYSFQIRMPLPRQAFHRLKPGLPVIAYPDYSFQTSSSLTSVSTGINNKIPTLL